MFQVTEVSEGGMRMIVNSLNSMYKGLSVKGILNLNDEDQVEIEGAVLRFDQGEVIVQLRKGPTFKIMVEQQRHIKQNTLFSSLNFVKKSILLNSFS